MIDPDNIASAACGLLIGWIARSMVRTRRWHIDDYHRRKIGTGPAPYSSAAIAFCATQEEAATYGWANINPVRQALPRLDPGPVQRGNGHGGPTAPKPRIKPQPSRVRLIRIEDPDLQLMDQPSCVAKPTFPPPREIRDDFLP